MIDNKEINIGVRKIICFAPKKIKEFPDWKHIKVKQVGFFSGNLWEQIDLPLFVRNGILFSPANIGPYIVRNQIVTMHDASVFAVPEAYSALFKLKYKIIMKHLGETSDLIITDSEFSKSELVKYLGVPPQKIQVIYLGHEHIQNISANNEILNKFNLLQNPFFLTVGSNSPHKNVEVIYKALKFLDCSDFNIVIAGGSNSSIFNTLEQQKHKNIIPVGYVSDSELRSLYEQAIGYIFPSTYEGFGFPILEALSFGCPVISSDAASLPEVGLDNVDYFSPDNPVELASKMEKILHAKVGRVDPEVISDFSWKRTVREFINFLPE
jgi:glycosyltransferase involved in cell wall biosynthesis